MYYFGILDFKSVPICATIEAMGLLGKKIDQLEREIENLKQRLALAKLQAIKDRQTIHKLKCELNYFKISGSSQSTKSP